MVSMSAFASCANLAACYIFPLRVVSQLNVMVPIFPFIDSWFILLTMFRMSGGSREISSSSSCR